MQAPYSQDPWPPVEAFAWQTAMNESGLPVRFADTTCKRGGVEYKMAAFACRTWTIDRKTGEKKHYKFVLLVDGTNLDPSRIR